MRITESRLRRMIHQVILESTGGKKSLAKEYIFTWFPDKLQGKQGHEWIVPIIEKNYSITQTIPWGIQKIYKCLPK